MAIAKKTAAPKAALTTKDITPVMTEFVAYIEEQTGYSVDPMSVQLGGTLRGDFQKSEGNQARMAARKEAVAAEIQERAEKKAAALLARDEKAAARAAKAAEPKAEKVVKAPVEKKAPAAQPAKAATSTKPTAKTTAKTAPKATPVRRRAAAAAQKDGAEF